MRNHQKSEFFMKNSYLMRFLFAILLVLPASAESVINLRSVGKCVGIAAVVLSGAAAFYFGTQAYCGNSPAECIDFAREYLNHPKEIGFPAPCSVFLAQELISKIPFGRPEGIRILEAGAGTGIVTKQIISKLGANDRLDVVELEKPLYDILVKKFGNDPRISIHCCSILDFNAEKYDAAVSTIPYNLLPENIVKDIWQHTFGLLKKDAPVSFVNLIGGSTLRSLSTFGEAHKAFNEQQLFMKKLFDVCGVQKKNVIASWPPITVTHLENRWNENSF